MNKLELVDHIATEAELTKVSAAAALEAVLEGITNTLKKGEEVRLVGFGTFSVRERAAGKGPQPGDRQGDQDRRVEKRALQARRGAEGEPQQEGEQRNRSTCAAVCGASTGAVGTAAGLLGRPVAIDA